MSSCVFCGIVRGDEPARVVGESPAALAFLPIRPAAVGHTLIIPRDHVRDIWELTPALAASVMETVLKMSHAIRNALAPEGLNLITSAGRAASQTVFHVHFHLVPRWTGDQIGDMWPPRGNGFGEDAPTEWASRLSAAFDAQTADH
ncbi:HIT family protein [Actinomadura sp. 21ATH]|uniref:HIT family protein n=1 Tax=Actinomadura sp. 21ATH TaxID=1735444 RepID=UPI0035BF2AFA